MAKKETLSLQQFKQKYEYGNYENRRFHLVKSDGTIDTKTTYVLLQANSGSANNLVYRRMCLVQKETHYVGEVSSPQEMSYDTKVAKHQYH